MLYRCAFWVQIYGRDKMRPQRYSQSLSLASAVAKAAVKPIASNDERTVSVIHDATKE